jgi:hypothetical protein
MSSQRRATNSLALRPRRRICTFFVKLLFQMFLSKKEVQCIEHFVGQLISEHIDTSEH